MLHNLQKKFNKCLSVLKGCPAHLVILPVLFAGILLKNLLLQTFIAGTNSFKPQLEIVPSIMIAGLFFSLITTLLLLCPTFLFKKSGAKIGYGLTVSLLMTLLLLVDCLYYRGFSEIPSISILSALSGDSAGAGTTAITDSIAGLISPYDLLYLADYLLLGVFALFRKFYKSTEHIKSRLHAHKEKLSFFFDHTLRYRLIRFSSYGALCLSVLLFLPTLHVLGAVEDVYYDLYDSAFAHNTVFYFTPIGYHLANIMNVVEKKVDEVLPDVESDVETAEERYQRELIEAYYKQFAPLADNDYAGIFKDKNVILIQVESLENMAIGQSVGGVEITPTLNKLVSAGSPSLYFPNVYDQTKAGNSSDCDLMINTSLLPTGDVFFRSYSDKKLPSLPAILRNQNYGTYYYNGSGPSSVWPYTDVYNNVFGYVTDENDPNCNFHMIEGLTPADKVYRYSSDENTFRYVLADLQNKKGLQENFFTQIVLCSSHMPFRYDNISAEENRNLIPQEYWLPVPEDERLAESKTFHYLNTLHYVDAQIGIFLENAEQAGLLEDTVVLIYGDHLGLHKYYPSEAESIAEDYPEYAFVNANHYNSIPLIIYDPSGKTEHQTFTIPAGQSDIMPTLLYLLGVDSGEYVFALGKVLVNTDRNYTVTSNGTLIGELPDEQTERILKLAYKISDYLVNSEYLDVSEHARGVRTVTVDEAAPRRKSNEDS